MTDFTSTSAISAAAAAAAATTTTTTSINTTSINNNNNNNNTATTNTAPSTNTSHTSFWADANSYEMLTRIGCGAFSSVFRAKVKAKENDSTEHAYVAIKVMDLENITSSFEDILQEVQTMKMCDNMNILRCYCSFVHADQLWLVTEMMDKGSCLRVMNIAKALGMGDGMNEEWLAYILREALQGLHYLHNNGQIHRDVKSGNILLNAQGSVRLADFGVSGWTVNSGQRQKTVKTFVGTPVYMAPEVMEQAGGYDFRADIWSLGITALELAKGVAPYAQYSAMKVLVMTIEEEPPSLKSYPAPNGDRQRNGAPFSRHFEEFYKRCLQKSPKLRPTTDELLKHKFLKNRSSQLLVEQLLQYVPSVGSASEMGPLSSFSSSSSSSSKSLSAVDGEAFVGDLDGDEGFRGERAGGTAMIAGMGGYSAAAVASSTASAEAIGAGQATVDLSASRRGGLGPMGGGARDDGMTKTKALDDAGRGSVGVLGGRVEKEVSVVPGMGAGAGGETGTGTGTGMMRASAKPYVAGTTWVFDDDTRASLSGTGAGAGVRTESRPNGDEHPEEAASDIDSFLNDFESNQASMMSIGPGTGGGSGPGSGRASGRASAEGSVRTELSGGAYAIAGPGPGQGPASSSTEPSNLLLQEIEKGGRHE